MQNPFAFGSAPIDWCEGNYAITRYIAEFYNTISNIFFFVIPPILIYLYIPYGKNFNQSIHVVWIMLFIIGICSTYFHATLSLAGQLLDELAILWILIIVFSFWFPRRLLPSFFGNDMLYFKWLIFSLGVLCTYLSCINPTFNAFVLMAFGIPATILLIYELKDCHCQRVYRLGLRSCLAWGLALGSWFIDKSLCHHYVLLKTFPYLHSLWHVFIVFATYGVCVLFTYFHAQHEAPKQLGTPVLRYWPCDAKYTTLKNQNNGMKNCDTINRLSCPNYQKHFPNFTYLRKCMIYLNQQSIQLLPITRILRAFFFNNEIYCIPYVLFLPTQLASYKNKNLEELNGHQQKANTYKNSQSIQYNQFGCKCISCLCNFGFYEKKGITKFSKQ